MKQWTIDYLDENPYEYLIQKKLILMLIFYRNISSLKSEFFPWLVRKQFRREKPPKFKQNPHPSSMISAPPKRQIFDFIKIDEVDIELQRLQLEDDQLNHDEIKRRITNIYPESKIKCFTQIIGKDAHCIRANTIAGYFEANKLVLENQASFIDKNNTLNNETSNTEGANRSILGNIKIGEKTSIKRSIIGNGCAIGDKVKLTKSFLMENIVIEEGCNIQGSIICSNVHIGNNCEIKDCIIADSQNIVSLSKN